MNPQIALTPQRVFMILAALLALVVAACEPKSGGCTPADLVTPNNLDPAEDAIVLDLEPLFVWDYPWGCAPDEYQVEVTTYGGYGFGVTQIHNNGDGLITNWIFANPLEPATQYEWRVAAIIDSVMSDYSTSTDFWTGPICDTDLLDAPEQNTPANGATVGTEFPPMGWSYPDGCIPEETLLQLDVDPTFPGPNLVVGSGGPRIGQIPSAALADCTLHYWRVRSANPDGVGPWSQIWSFYTDFDGLCAPPPTCPTPDLVAPIPDYPSAFEIVDDLTPILNWVYPDTCEPEGYRLDIGLYQADYDVASTVSGGTGNPSTNWTPASSLDPATRYEWRVAPINGETLGPYSSSVPFFTGPVCVTADLVPPDLVSPLDGSIVETPNPALRWDPTVGGCVPEGLRAQIDIDPAFPAPFHDYYVSLPHNGQVPIDPLDDCTWYYWHVQAVNDDSSASAYSPTWSFFTDFEGACVGGAGPAPAAGGPWMGRAERDLNCRAGDGTIFTETGFWGEGEEDEIVGRNEAGSWLLTARALGGGNCWVSAPYIELLGGILLEDIVVVASPPTPTPTPTPVATSTPTPVPSAPFAVTNVTVSVDQTQFTGKCPVRFTFTGQITTNGAGTVDFQWERSDGATIAPQTLSFGSAGTQTVTATWDISSGVHTNLWMRIQILSPNSMTSNQATFSVTCQ